MRGSKDWMAFTVAAVLVSAGRAGASPVGLSDLAPSLGGEASFGRLLNPVDRILAASLDGFFASPMDVPALPGTAGAFVGSFGLDGLSGAARTASDGFAAHSGVDFGPAESPDVRSGISGVSGSDLVTGRLGGMIAMTGTGPFAMFGEGPSRGSGESDAMLPGGRPFTADPFDRANDPGSVVGHAHPDGVSLFVPPSAPLPAAWLAALGLLAPVGIARAIRRRG